MRDAYQRLLDGVSLGQIARRWNSLGLYTPQGSHLWTGATVGTCLRKPRNTGLEPTMMKSWVRLSGLPWSTAKPGTQP